ncbi:hypothetical protein BGX38DRAFT_1275083 [Terfezia claveryi]|nr:hypothetical protein BGX38DRAFT_1275083 [Terfezia claveryi]
MNSEQAKQEWSGEGDWELHISQIERKGRQDEESIKLEGLDFFYTKEDKQEEILESITIRPMRQNGSFVTSMTHHWVLSTPKRGPVAWQSVCQKEEFEEEGQSDNEAMRVRSRRNGKKPRLEGQFTLEDLEDRLGRDMLEPAVSRTVEEIKGNLYRDKVPDAMEVDNEATPGRKTPGLEASRYTVVDLTEEELEEMAKNIIEGQNGKKDDEMETEEEESSRIRKELLEETRIRNLEEIELVIEAKRTWRSVSKVRPGKFARVEKELIEMKKQLALLAVSLGAGIPEQVAEAKRTINARKRRIEEEKRKQKELKKVERKRRKDEAGRKQEEKNKEEAVKLAEQARKVKESQQKAREACEASIQDLINMFKADLSYKELITLGQKLQEAEDIKKKIEKEAKGLVERSVGQSRQIIGAEVFKIVWIVMGHTQPIDAKGRIELEEAVGKV